MAVVVVDTDVVSFGFKKDTRWRQFRRLLLGHERRVSFMTVAELEYWAISQRWGTAKREELERHLRGYTMIYPDRETCRLWAEIMDGARRQGQPMDKADAWIAATALSLEVPLVTHNAADFNEVEGLDILAAKTP